VRKAHCCISCPAPAQGVHASRNRNGASWASSRDRSPLERSVTWCDVCVRQRDQDKADSDGNTTEFRDSVKPRVGSVALTGGRSAHGGRRRDDEDRQRQDEAPETVRVIRRVQCPAIRTATDGPRAPKQSPTAGRPRAPPLVGVLPASYRAMEAVTAVVPSGCRSRLERLSTYRLGNDRGSPNHGRTVFSKRVIALISSPARVRTKRPTPWLMPVESRT
jgi:hypothetical protein